MKSKKNLLTLFLALVLILSTFTMPLSAAERAGDVTTVVTTLTANPTEVFQGDFVDLTVGLTFTTPTEQALVAGDTVTLTTNIGELFTRDWVGVLNAIPIIGDLGTQIGTAAFTADTLTITFANDFPDSTFVNLSFSTGKRLQANDVGAKQIAQLQRI